MKHILKTLLIIVSIIVGFVSFTALLIAKKIHSIHAVTGEAVNSLANGDYFLITVMTMLSIAVIIFITKERHFA